MDRAELEDAVISHGVNPNTFGVTTSYSPILEHPATNVWCLVGHSVDPANVEALREILASRPRVKRTIDFGWSADGRLYLSTVIPDVNSPVILIPAAIASYVKDQTFDAIAEDGTGAGRIVVDPDGYSWGYGPYLRRRGADDGIH